MILRGTVTFDCELVNPVQAPAPPPSEPRDEALGSCMERMRAAMELLERLDASGRVQLHPDKAALIVHLMCNYRLDEGAVRKLIDLAM